MTDGTSQGLFIVVAIIVFGIFVVLAYILFEDTLSPALASMFTNATETANFNLKSKDNLLNYQTVIPYVNYHSNYTVKGDTVFLTAVKPFYLVLGYITDENPLVTGNTYRVSGYLYIDGVPASSKNWKSKKISTYQEEENTVVDDETGYFEGFFVRSYPTRNFLHALIYDENGVMFPEGTVFSIKQLTLEDITKE